MTQLQKELDEVKFQAVQKLEREVYNKTVWQRLTDPIRRKQHSFINMVCATFAYILAYNLHLKSTAHKEALAETEEQTTKTRALQTLLRSLVCQQTIQEIVDRTVLLHHHQQQKKKDRDDSCGGGVVVVDDDDDALKNKNKNNTGNKNADDASAVTKLFRGWFGTSSSSSRTKDDTGVGRSSPSPADSSTPPTSVVVDRDDFVQALKSVLEEKIGDEGLDDETKKQKTIQKIWKDNKEQQQVLLQKQKQQQKQQQKKGADSVVDEEDLLDEGAGLPVQILLPPSSDDDQDRNIVVGKTAAVVDDDELTAAAAAAPLPTTSTNKKQQRRRVFDMM